MTSFVRAEYVMACVLAEKAKNGLRFVDVDDICKCGLQMQKACNEQNLDVIFTMTHDSVCDVLRTHSDYFKGDFDKNGNAVRVTFADNKGIDDLNGYFLANVPKGILAVMLEVINQEWNFA